MADVLVVTSKVKKYLAGKDMRTSGDVAEALSEHIRQVLDVAKDHAKADGVKTVKGAHVERAVEELKE